MTPRDQMYAAMMRRRNPPLQARAMTYAFPQPGAQQGYAAPGSVLSAGDVAYLMDRSLRFQQTLGEAMELPWGAVLNTEEGEHAVATLAATALAGDDFNYATGQPSVGWNGMKWAAAYNLVKNQVKSWLDEYAGSHPVPTPP